MAKHILLNSLSVSKSASTWGFRICFTGGEPICMAAPRAFALTTRGITRFDRSISYWRSASGILLLSPSAAPACFRRCASTTASYKSTFKPLMNSSDSDSLIIRICQARKGILVTQQLYLNCQATSLAKIGCHWVHRVSTHCHTAPAKRFPRYYPPADTTNGVHWNKWTADLVFEINRHSIHSRYKLLILVAGPSGPIFDE